MFAVYYITCIFLSDYVTGGYLEDVGIILLMTMYVEHL